MDRWQMSAREPKVRAWISIDNDPRSHIVSRAINRSELLEESQLYSSTLLLHWYAFARQLVG